MKDKLLDMNKVKMLIFSFSLWPIGYLYEKLFYVSWGAFMLVGMFLPILVSAYWFWVGFKSHDYSTSKKQAILWGNFFAIVNVIFIMMGPLVNYFHFHFWPSIYFSPMMNLSAFLNRITFFTVHAHWTSYISFLIMLLVYNAGYAFRDW